MTRSPVAIGVSFTEDYRVVVDLGVARGWDVQELDDGGWAWSAWGRSRSGSGVEASEEAAGAAARRELEEIAAEERAAANKEHEVSAEDERRPSWDPQF